MGERMQGFTGVRATTCSNCMQQCGVLVHVEDGRVTKITGDKDHPMSQGFICIKGARAAELHYDARRIHRPLKRTGKRGEGLWQEVGWDEALDTIAAKLQPLVREFGPESVALAYGTYHGPDMAIGVRFLNLLGSPNGASIDRVCAGPSILAEALTFGFGLTVVSPVPGVTKSVVLWGRRPSASMPLQWKQVLQTHRQGAQLIVVDPQCTPEAKQADLWLQIRPGTDAALALGWLHIIIKEGLYDREFVAKYTVGFAELRERVGAFPPQKVAAMTGIPAELVIKSVRLFATNRPGLLDSQGTGLWHSGMHALQSVRAIACLVAITGNLDRQGGHWLAGPPQAIVSNGEALLADRLSDAQRHKQLGADRFRFMDEGYTRLDAAMQRAWYGKHHLLRWANSAHIPSLWRAIKTGEPYPVKALFVQHHNPLGAHSNAKMVAEALQSPHLDLLVVHDLFLTTTAQFADYVLPACHWLEKPFFSAGVGLLAFLGDYAAANATALLSEFEHHNDYELWRDLGRRLGQGADWPATLEAFWDECVRPAGLSFAGLAQQRGPWTAAAPRYEKFATQDPANDSPGFGTPSGKVELRSEILAALGYDPLPNYEEPETFRRWSQDYPLVLTTGGRIIEGYHHDSQRMPWFRKKYPHPLVRMHPETAGALGIGDGDWVAVETPVGRVKHVARLTETMAPGVVQADRWWYPERSGEAPGLYGFWETNINVCTEDDPDTCDPVIGSWPLRGLQCRLVKVEGETTEGLTGLKCP